MSDQHETESVDARMAQVEGQMEALLQVVATQTATIASLEQQLAARTSPAAPGPVDPTRSVQADAPATVDRTMGRRRLLLGGATATAAAAAAVVVGSGTPAAAANGGSLILGQGNNATAATTLTYGGSSTNAFAVTGPSTKALVEGTQTGNGPAIKGTGTVGSGIEGASTDGTGVVGSSLDEYGVKGSGYSGGVLGNGSISGVEGFSTDGAGVFGRAPNGVGVFASSMNNTAIVANGPTAIRLESYDGRPAPILDGGSHYSGEIVIATSDVWLCVASGTPGTWQKIGGPTTAGQFHVLPAPVRVYDSRTGTAPSQGPKTKLTGNAARPIDCTHNSSTVPKGATAVALTVLIVNAFNGNGNMTIWANGAARPSANTAVWGTGSGRYTTTAICALDANAKIQVAASASTDLVLDVVGYYR